MKKNQNATYDLKYHIVLVTKNKQEIITDEIGNFLVENIKRLLADKGEIYNMAYNKNHLFMLVEIKPQYALAVIINSLKSSTSRLVKSAFSWEGSFWDNNYFISTVGEFSRENAKNYIQSRK